MIFLFRKAKSQNLLPDTTNYHKNVPFPTGVDPKGTRDGEVITFTFSFVLF